MEKEKVKLNYENTSCLVAAGRSSDVDRKHP